VSRPLLNIALVRARSYGVELVTIDALVMVNAVGKDLLLEGVIKGRDPVSK
jgi:hypothetical protein